MCIPRLSRQHLLLLGASTFIVLSVLLLSTGELQGQISGNTAPTITNTGTTESVPENTTASVQTYTASDAETAVGDLVWSLAGEDSEDFDFEENSAGTGYELKFKTPPDFEAPSGAPDPDSPGLTPGTDSDNTYKVTVKVEDDDSDDKKGAALLVTITVTNVDEAGMVTISGVLEAGNELTAVVTDPDGSVTGTTWQWSRGDTADGNFTDIDSATNATYTSVVNDVGKFLKAEATYKDPESTTVDKMAETVTGSAIEASNFGPAFPSSETGMRSVDENTAANTNIGDPVSATDSDTDEMNNPLDTLTYALIGTDADSFNFDTATGQIKTKAALDYETKDSYTVIVTVSDGSDLAGGDDTTEDARITVTITVDDINERPVVSGATGPSFAEIEYDDNAAAAELIIGTYSATDDDNSDNSVGDSDYQTITWEKSGADADHFSIDSTTGVLSFSIEPDFEDAQDANTDNDYVVVVEADDGEGETNSVGTLTVTVTVTNVDETPEFISPPADRDFPEIEYDFDGAPDLVVATFTARDEEMEDITWTLAPGGDSDELTITENSSGEGVVAFDNRPNFEMSTGSGTTSNIYEFTVVITDATASPNILANQRTHDYVVTVTDVNERPEFTGTPLTADDWNENDERTMLQVGDYDARDEEGGVTWSVTGTDSDKFGIDSNGVVTIDAVPDYETLADLSETDGRHPLSFNVVATDTMSGSTRRSAEVPVTITIVDLEEPGAIVVVHKRNGQEIANSDLSDLDVDDVLEFTLSDPDGIPTLLTDAAINWAIERRNQGGTDNDWVALTGQDVTSLSKTYTVDEDDTGKEIRATVTYTDRRDSGKMTESDDTDAAVDEREVAPPRFRSGATQTIPEGPAGRDTDVEIMATDRDGEVLIWSIRDGPDSDLFEILPSDEPTTFTYSGIDYPGYAVQLRAIEALDYETVASDDPDCPSKSLCLTLTLSDGKAFSNGSAVYDDEVDVTYDITIGVTDVEEPGEITLSLEEVPEPGVEITATLTDPDGGISGETWQWERSEDPEADSPVWDDISGATSASYTPSATDDVVSGGDNDGDGYFLRATVSYTDGEGSGKSAEAIAGQVGTANTRPQFPATENGQRTVPENSRAGTSIGDPVSAEDPENNSLTYTLTGTDAESFTIVSSTGQLRVKDLLDFEEQDNYNVTIEVTDRRDAAGRSSSHIDDTQLVTITVENVDEEGTIALTTVTNRVQATVPIITELSDLDGGLSNITWQWARSSNRSDWTDIAGATSAEYTPTATNDDDTDEEDQGNYLRATASYTDGEGSGKTAEAITARVAAAPPTNTAPVFPDSEDGQRELPEDASTGTLILGPVQATDFNDDVLTYTLSGSDSSFFTVDASGQLRLRLEQDQSLDYERKGTYRFTVQVSDGANDDDEPDEMIDDTVTVTVSLIDVNEAPVITGESEREFRENGTSAVATYSARDPEGDNITWSVAGADGNYFFMTDQGQLYFSEPPSFEDGETYRVTVTATDDDETSPLSASLNVTVTVIDVEEMGTIIIQPTRGWVVDAVLDDPETMDIDETQPALQTRFTAILDDDDTPVTDLTWQWARAAGEEIIGATSDSYTATADDVNRYLRVTATYDDSFDDSDSLGNPVPETVTAILRAPIRETSPAANTRPRFTVPSAQDLPGAHFDTRTITSGPVSGRSIGSRVSATDAEGDVLTYTLRGRDADTFDIDTATGQIRTRRVLNHLEQDTYTLSVSVHDGFDSYYRPSESIDDTIFIIITVTEPPQPQPRRRVRVTTTNDPPPNRPAEFSDGDTTNRSVLESAEVGSDVGRPVSASDPDGDTLTYTLGGDDAGSFDIDASTGQLQTKAALDAETKSSYSVTVSVTDNKSAGGGTLADVDDTITVVITVTTVELPEIAAKYDADEDGLISRDEAMEAVTDFYDGDLTRDEALEVITLYFESPATITELLG